MLILQKDLSSSVLLNAIFMDMFMEVSIPWGYRDIIQSSWHPRCTEGDVPDRLIVSQVGPQAPPKAEAIQIWSLVQPKKNWEHLSVHLRSIRS